MSNASCPAIEFSGYVIPAFVIIADDLTGAADSGVQFARNGHPATICFRGEDIPKDASGVIVLDTDSRAETPDEASRRILHATESVKNARVWFKKIDSTLRGNIAAETASLMDAAGLEHAVIAPAFPAAGRTTKGGTQFLAGVPVHQTEFSRDPRTPVASSYLPEMMPDPSQTAMLGVRDLSNADEVERTIGRTRYTVVDARNDFHLTSLVKAVGEPSGVLWVGSAGLSGALASEFPGAGGSHPSESFRPVTKPLVVVGSLSDVSREQVRELRLRSSAVLLEVGSDAEGIASEAGRSLDAGDVVVLHSPARVGLHSPEVTENLASVTASLEGKFDSLVLTGGDTAVGVAKRLGATGMRVFGEVEPGVPYGELVGGARYPVITKAGAFGQPGTLCAAVDHLREIRKENPRHEN